MGHNHLGKESKATPQIPPQIQIPVMAHMGNYQFLFEMEIFRPISSMTSPDSQTFQVKFATGFEATIKYDTVLRGI
jgi:hypothetical protein